MTTTGQETPPAAQDAPAAVPLALATPAGTCLAWYHPPAGPIAARAVLLCGPAGHEAVPSYPTMVQLARTLAAAGLPVLRFDYPGSGDACGADDDPARVAAWRGAIDAAAAELGRLSGLARLALLGIRLGGTLACEAASRLPAVEALALWAAPASGRDYARELRLAGREGADGALVVAGTTYAADTLRELQALQACAQPARPGLRVLVASRDDLPRADPLPARLREAGARVDELVLPGYAALLQGELVGALSEGALDTLRTWLRPAGPATPAAPRGATPPQVPPTWRDGSVRETLVRFGEAGLCGVLSAPERGAANGVGIVLASVGPNYRVGPHRLNVALARTLAADGCHAVRLDLAGCGDSEPLADGRPPQLYDTSACADLRAAIDLLEQQGCRTVLLAGLCSGAFLAFQTALRDRRVAGLVLVNARLLRWTPRRPGAGWQEAHELNVRTLRAYRNALGTGITRSRLLAGAYGPRWLLRRVTDLARERWRRLAGGPTVAQQVRGLCAAGRRVLVLVGDTDDARGYVEYQFGRGGSRLRGCEGFEMRDLPGDHNFNGPGEQAALLARVRAFVAARMTPARAAAQQAPGASPHFLPPVPFASGE